MNDGTTDQDGKTAKRRWWLALLLFIFAGAGYLYVGRPRRYFASIVFYLLIIAMLFLVPGTVLSQPVLFLAMICMVLAVLLGMTIDQIRLSIKQPRYGLRWYNRWWIYAGCFFVMMVVTYVPDMLGGQAAQTVRTFSIPSRSGLPALQVGDVISVNNDAYRTQKPARGDIVVFTTPRNKSITWIKRVIGLPGDQVQLKDGRVFINGTQLKQEAAGTFTPAGQKPIAQFREYVSPNRSYLTLDSASTAADNTRRFTVPPEHYFVLGDNRDNSSDSRFAQIGPIPADHILARATGIIFALQMSRIGTGLH